MARKIDHEERKAEIVQRAIRLFSQVGFDNVSLIMIAAAAGVSRTLLYRYFCSKREVMDAAIVAVTDRIKERCIGIVKTRESYSKKLELVCHEVVEVMFENKEFLVAVFDFVVGMVRTGADMNASIASFTHGTRDILRLLISHAKESGEIPEVLVVDRIADTIYAQFESCAMRIVLGTEHDASAAKVRCSDIVRAITIWK